MPPNIADHLADGGEHDIHVVEKNDSAWSANTEGELRIGVNCPRGVLAVDKANVGSTNFVWIDRESRSKFLILETDS
jgi:hypothetical protein